MTVFSGRCLPLYHIDNLYRDHHTDNICRDFYTLYRDFRADNLYRYGHTHNIFPGFYTDNLYRTDNIYPDLHTHNLYRDSILTFSTVIYILTISTVITY